MLQKYEWTEDWYLGKPSIKAPLEILDREHMPVIFIFNTKVKNADIYDMYMFVDIFHILLNCNGMRECCLPLE